MTEKRTGRQTPTTSFVLPYTESKGKEAIELYNQTTRTAQPWQELLLEDILATNEDGLWVHTKFGYSLPRRNGKNEILSIREMWGIINGEHILHTAHLTSTSSSASKRLAQLLKECGYEEVIRVRKDVPYEKAFSYSKQFGLERIAILGENGGQCSFRTRTSNGGLGEGFDLLVIDEAQEYQQDQESTLKYTVTDSPNPQTLLCGTPPTAVSKGTVFPKLRNEILSGSTRNGAWEEWGVERQTDVHDIDSWYECNPSMGYHLNERKVEDEIGQDEIDFNIQRLGWWASFNQRSIIKESEWTKWKVETTPNFKGKLHVGIKYGKGTNNVSMSIAVRTDTGIYVECLDCREKREGNRWIINFLMSADIERVIIDGIDGQTTIEKELKDYKFKKYKFPTVKEVIEANSTFEVELFKEDGTIQHNNQPSLMDVVTNCERRAIGSNGGFGYKCIKEDLDISLMESMIFAFWSCYTTKPKRKQRIVY